MLRNHANVEFVNNSRFYLEGRARIIGHEPLSPCPWGFDESDSYMPEVFSGSSVRNHDGIGDFIRFVNSSANLGRNTTIEFGDQIRQWGGIGFYFDPELNSGTVLVSTFRGNISGIQNLIIRSSRVNFNGLTIKGIGRLSIFDNSNVTLSGVNYSMNDHGIFSCQSALSISGSTISDNRSNGLTMQGSNQISHIVNSRIYFNYYNGVVTIGSQRIDFTHTDISNNGLRGFYSLGNVSSNFLGISSIYNNHGVEVVARGVAFPWFDRLSPNITIPSVSDSEKPPFTLGNRHLFRATSDFEGQIRVGNLNIDRSNPDRFYPSLDRFVFGTSNIGVSVKYASVLSYIHQHMYQEAFTIIRDGIIGEHPYSFYAVSSVSVLPHIFRGKGACCCELFEYLESIDAVQLQQNALETLALAKMGNRLYYEAIILFQRIVDDPPGELERLLAELNIAHASLRLAEMGSRSVPVVSSRTASTRNEFMAIERDIMDRINKLFIVNDEYDIVAEVPEVFEFAVSNFPNPFNPYTTIRYTIGNVENVVINVYNVRGQRVRTLLNEQREPGHHSVIWNGTDDSGRTMSSGIYLYRIVAGENTATRRMLLMK